MSDRINLYQSGKIYTMRNNKTIILEEYIQNYTKEVTTYRKLITPCINDFNRNKHIDKLFNKYDIVSSRHNKIAEDIITELIILDKHGCIHNKKPINTTNLDLLKIELLETYESMLVLLEDLYIDNPNRIL